MSERTNAQTTEIPAPVPGGPALAVAVLLFVGLYLWGFILGVAELAQRESPV